MFAILNALLCTLICFRFFFTDYIVQLVKINLLGYADIIGVVIIYLATQ